MVIRKYPALVTVALWLTATLYGIYWAIQNAIWIRSTERKLGISNQSRYKLIRNGIAVYFGYFILEYITSLSGKAILFDFQSYIPAFRILNTFLWFGFLSYMLWDYVVRIRGIQKKLGIEDEIKTSTAFLLVFLFYSSGTYLQRHINKVEAKVLARNE